MCLNEPLKKHPDYSRHEFTSGPQALSALSSTLFDSNERLGGPCMARQGKRAFILFLTCFDGSLSGGKEQEQIYFPAHLQCGVEELVTLH